MKKRIMIAAAVLLVAALLVAGCYAKRNSAEDIEKTVEKTVAGGAMMATVYVDSPMGGRIAYDTETRVMYWISCGACNFGTATVMVDQNGKPRLWAH